MRIYMYIYIYIGGLGELERFILPPVTGRSASFRLRFRFVRAVRAGEAKQRGRIQTVVLIAGPPGCEYPGVFARGLSFLFCAQVHGFYAPPYKNPCKYKQKHMNTFKAHVNSNENEPR